MTRPGIEPESTVSVADALSTRPLIGYASMQRGILSFHAKKYLQFAKLLQIFQKIISFCSTLGLYLETEWRRSSGKSRKRCENILSIYINKIKRRLNTGNMDTQTESQTSNFASWVEVVWTGEMTWCFGELRITRTYIRCRILSSKQSHWKKLWTHGQEKISESPSREFSLRAVGDRHNWAWFSAWFKVKIKKY